MIYHIYHAEAIQVIPHWYLPAQIWVKTFNTIQKHVCWFCGYENMSRNIKARTIQRK